MDVRRTWLKIEAVSSMKASCASAISSFMSRSMSDSPSLSNENAWSMRTISCELRLLPPAVNGGLICDVVTEPVEILEILGRADGDFRIVRLAGVRPALGIGGMDVSENRFSCDFDSNELR